MKQETEPLADVQGWPDSQFAWPDGVRIHLRRQGREDAPRLLLLHGFGASTACWDLVMEALDQAGYQIWRADFPGFGLSSRRAGLDHTLDANARRVWAALDQVHPKHAVWRLVGHSMGGAVAAEMLRQRPSAVRQLILVDSAFFGFYPWRILTVLLRSARLARFLERYIERQYLTDNRIRRLLARAYGRPATAVEIERNLRPLLLPGTARCLVDWVRSLRPVVTAPLGERTDVAAIWGVPDRIVPFGQARRLARQNPQMPLFQLPGAGHVPMETQPERFLAILLPLLKS